jgi:hypothetical protein
MRKEKETNRMPVVAAILLLSLFIPTVAAATTYTSSINFASHLEGAKRNYTAGQMYCSMTAYTPTVSKSFEVTCWKSVPGFDDKVGTTKIYSSSPSGVYNKRYFGNGVSSGEYYFDFDMTSYTGDPVLSNNVKMVTE